MSNRTIQESERKNQRKAIVADVVTREYTIHIGKAIHGCTRKTRAPRAIKAIKSFATKAMSTSDVRVDPMLNKAIWEKGIKSIPRRVRVRLSRKRNEEEGAKNKLYTFVTYVPVTDFHGLETETIDE